MRTEQQMMDLILNTAKNDKRIRALYMNGSRTNPTIEKDIYQDYDIVYVVTETESFLADKDWILAFGELAIVQEPDSNDFGWGITANFSQSYGWLMLFRDGNRIDLHIQVKEKMLEDYTTDSLTIPLLDKDHILPKIPDANDRNYHIKKPTEEQYKGCCNEFRWCLNNVAKGIARDELPYAMAMYNLYVRDMLNKMIEWHIGIDTDFSLSAGKDGKFFKKHLSERLYKMYANTYSDSNYENVWASVFTACELFRTMAQPVAKHFGYRYHQSDDMNMMEYLRKVKNNGL